MGKLDDWKLYITTVGKSYSPNPGDMALSVEVNRFKKIEKTKADNINFDNSKHAFNFSDLDF